MYKFSNRSLERLETCNEKLQVVCNELIKIYDVSILEGHRTNERQEQLFHEGKSKLRAGESKHNSNPSKAVDIAPYPIDWNDLNRFYFMAGIVKKISHEYGFNIRWGGDWNQNNNFKDQSFFDLPHFELME